MQRLPQGWVAATVGDTGRYINGMAFKPMDWAKNGRPIIRIQNLTDTTKPFNFTTTDPGDDLLVDPGDLLVSWSATLDAFLWHGPQGVLNQHIFKVVPAKGIDARFLYFLLRIAITEMRESEHLHGSTMKHINRGPFLAHAIALPPLAEQRRIVARIDALFARTRKAKEALDRIPPLLERLKKSILAAAFRGELTRTWRDQRAHDTDAGARIAALHTERKKRWAERWGARTYQEAKVPDFSGAPSLPAGWIWATWEMLATRVTVGHVGSMKDQYVTAGVPFLRSQNVRENRYDPAGLCFISEAFHRSLGKSELRPGDIVVVRSGNVGTTCVIPESMPAANCSDLVIIQGPIGVLSEYGSFWMNSAAAQNVIRAGSVGVALVHFNTGAVERMWVAVPPMAEQREIVQRLNDGLGRLRAALELVTAARARIDALESAILAKAFRGELVPQDPNDEPASVLLERIRAERAAAPAKKPRGRRAASAVSE